MDRELTNICQSQGWDTLYEEAMASSGKELGQENTQGERRAQSPFPFSDDRSPSFSVNVRNGLWRDWHTDKHFGIGGGNFVQFMALMNADLDDHGKPIIDFKEAERDLRLRYNIGRTTSAEWVESCQEAMKDPECPGHRIWLNAGKRWTRQTLIDLGVGYDKDSRRLMIPCYDRKDKLINARLYLPGAPNQIPKMYWQQPSMAGNFMFPTSGRTEEYVILCEGEPDVITLRSLGFNAVSGTLGAGTPVPESETRWFRGKDVYIVMDVDEPGIEAATNAINIILGEAKTLVRMDLPEWENRPANADISDWVAFLLDKGFDIEQVQRAIVELMRNSQIQNAILSKYDMKATQVPFTSAMSSQNLDRRLQVKAQVMATGNHRFALPIYVGINCPARGHSYCTGCSMHNQYHGSAKITIDPRSPIMLKMIQTDDVSLFNCVKKDNNIVVSCPDAKMTIIDSIDVDTALLVSTIDEEHDSTEEIAADRVRREAYILSYKGTTLLDTHDYVLEGFVYPAPKTQKLVFVLESARRLSSRFDMMSMTNESISIMRQFQTQNPFDMMQHVADDIAASSSLIVNRQDLHMFYRTIWYSVTSFQFMGRIIEHGWMEGLVVGDTRCGKSATFKAMSALFGTGELVDCKMQTAPGVLGAVETSALTGERYVVPGILPRQDRRGPVAFDEFSSSRESRQSMMDHLSSTRAEGKVKITKAATAEFWARVRQIYMANPGQSKLMRDIGGYGVEAILGLINQPEDIARFDIAMIVTQQDVSIEELNTVRYPTTPTFSMHAHRLLLQWAWSRRPEQIVWHPDAEQACVGLATAMYNKYDQSIPLVEPADQRMRIARAAVSIAAQCFSTDDSCENIIVGPEHVYAAGMLFKMCYDKPVMGYDKYSVRTTNESTIINPRLIEEMFDKRFGKFNVAIAEKLLHMHEFTINSFNIMVPMNGLEVNNTLQTLSANRCIQRSRSTRRGENYELTGQFVRFLGDYIKKKKAQATD